MGLAHGHVAQMLNHNLGSSTRGTKERLRGGQVRRLDQRQACMNAEIYLSTLPVN